eukprot:TRINITY_DN4661_c0_g1_i1.p1 TRINITY_DN4661_c0_g1~~TRINITY_DN4661_c0_g1_i1.p1  ORF type:complete len:418 (+),score=39.68 TRINITY_DN4661_c0_g1_i1:175-1428(+)
MSPCIHEKDNSTISSCHLFWGLKIYFILLKLIVLHRSGVYEHMDDYIKALRNLIQIYFPRSDNTRRSPQSVFPGLLFHWLQPSLLQGLACLFDGALHRSKADLALSKKALEEGDAHLNHYLQFEHATQKTSVVTTKIMDCVVLSQFEIRSQLIVDYLIECDFERACEFLVQLCVHLPQAQCLRAPEYVTAHVLCAHYSHLTSGRADAQRHFQRAMCYAGICSNPQEEKRYLRLAMCMYEVTTDVQSLHSAQMELQSIEKEAADANLQLLKLYAMLTRAILMSWELSMGSSDVSLSTNESKYLLRNALNLSSSQVMSKKGQMTALILLGRYFYSKDDKKSLDDALESALATAARMKDSIAQIVILQLYIITTSSDAEKYTSICQKRIEGLKESVAKAVKRSEYHNFLLKWDCSTSTHG